MPMPGLLEPKPPFDKLQADGQATTPIFAEPKLLGDRILVESKAISRCLTRVQEAEQILAYARFALSEYVAEEKAHDSKAYLHATYNSSITSAGSNMSTIGLTSANVTSELGQAKAADVQWDTNRSATKDRLSKLEAPQAVASTWSINSPSSAQPPLMKGTSKWSNIDRQGLIDQVVINGMDFGPKTLKEDDKKFSTSQGSLCRRTDSSESLFDSDVKTLMTEVPNVELVRSCCWMRIPVIHPSSQLRVGWLMFGIAFIIYEAFAIPFYLAYNVQPSGFWFYVVSVINGYFLLDILVTFLTGFVNKEGVVIMELRYIAYKYATSWLVPDVIAGIPWEWITADDRAAQFTRGIRFIRAFRLLRLTRLFRMMRGNAVSEKLEIFIEANQVFMFMVGLSRILFLLFGVTHWMACAWYSLGIREVDPQDTTWVQHYLSGRWGEEDKFARYIYSLYFTLTTMTTVGYGDMSAQNLEETIFVLCLLLVASIVFAGLMGVLTDLISTLNNEKNAMNDRKAQLCRYMRWRDVPKDLFLTIRQHILFLWDENEGYESYEEDIKGQLSPALKTELCFHIYGRLLYSSPFFAWMRDYTECLKQLSTMVQSLFLSRGDMLFRVGQNNEQIYLLLSGSVWLSRNQSLFHPSHMPLQLDTSEEIGPEGFMIPRHREGGFKEVGKMLKKKAPIRRSATLQKKGMEVISRWKRNMGSLRQDSREEAARQEEERKEQEAAFDKKNKKKYYGVATSQIFDSPILMEATIQLKRQDLREKYAALLIQRRWRVRTRTPGATRGPTRNKATAMTSKTVTAPAYFGESCLWAPIEQWGKEDPPLYTYTVRCESRCELVYIAREAIQEIVERFSPWLGERLESFRKSVVGQISDVSKSSEDARKSSNFQPVDWASMDLLPPQDDYSLDASHCKTLLRTSVPSRTEMTILRSAATHSRPAMPRTPSYLFDESHRSKSGLRRMPSGLTTSPRW